MAHIDDIDLLDIAGIVGCIGTSRPALISGLMWNRDSPRDTLAGQCSGMDDTLPVGPNPEPESVLGKTLAEGE